MQEQDLGMCHWDAEGLEPGCFLMNPLEKGMRQHRNSQGFGVLPGSRSHSQRKRFQARVPAASAPPLLHPWGGIRTSNPIPDGILSQPDALELPLEGGRDGTGITTG